MDEGTRLGGRVQSAFGCSAEKAPLRDLITFLCVWNRAKKSVYLKTVLTIATAVFIGKIYMLTCGMFVCCIFLIRCGKRGTRTKTIFRVRTSCSKLADLISKVRSGRVFPS